MGVQQKIFKATLWMILMKNRSERLSCGKQESKPILVSSVVSLYWMNGQVSFDSSHT
jgi:hypothetical protein